jgi:N-acetylmuramoyl-L-alanine amidase
MDAKSEQVAEHRPASRQRGRPVIDRLVTITLDPGHGGEDPGAVGSGGSYEKHVTLAVAKRLRAKIAADPNMRVVLTRESDFFVPLARTRR